MDGQFLPVLVLLLGASGLCGQGLGPRGPLEEPPEEKPPEEKPPEEEPPEEDGVLVLSRQTLGQALQEHPALLVEFCECQASMAGDPQGPPGCSAPPSLCSWGSIRALGQSWAWGPASRWGGTGAGGIQSVSPRLFREGPASTQAGVVQPIHRQEPLPAGRPPQADGGSWPHGWPWKIHPKPTLGTVLATAVPLGGPQGVWPPVLGLWPRLRWAPDEEGVDWTCCSLPDLKRGAGPEVGRLWPGWSRGCGGGGEGLGHSWVCPPDAPWCGHCRALAPEYSKAAALLAAESARVTLAKVDGPAEPELAEEFAVTEYPTLKFFREGNRTHPEEYTGPREAEGIAEWLRRRVGPSARQLEDEEDIRALTDTRDVVVVGFFQDLQDRDVATFLGLAQDALDMTFGLTDRPQLFQKFGLTKDTVVLFKKYDEGRADFPVDKELGLDQGDLSRFLLTHSMHLVTEYSSETSSKIFEAKILNHLLLFINQTLDAHRELLAGFREAAPPFRGQVLFVVVDVGADNDHVLQYFGLKAQEAPTLRFINIETTKKYAPEHGAPVTAATITDFCRTVLGGGVKPYHLSQEVPPDWDQRPVKTLVGKNFEQVAFDETKNVFIKFYAPWCAHCKEMAPAWEELAEKYRDHEDVIIAELDATANELEAFPVHGFPTLKYFPAGPGRKVIDYKGARDLETFSKFLDSGGELPAEEPAEVPGAAFPEKPGNTTEPKDEKPGNTTEPRDEL
ncbi:protein disulfide-isomerase A2 isoform X1 [Bos indicus]|uniref:protein disulfide-isomerase n=2 Tax=Bos TaxID=9903 RepID=A0A4W2DLA9_BOBOX